MSVCQSVRDQLYRPTFTRPNFTKSSEHAIIMWQWLGRRPGGVARTSLLPVLWTTSLFSHSRERKCADTIGTVPVPGLAIFDAKNANIFFK